MQDWILALGASPLVYLGLYLFATLDGFFPPVPSEPAVIALAALSISGGSPNLALILISAAAGAFTGDQIAYRIGSRVDVRGLPFARGGRGRRTLDWAERALTERGPSFLLAARYVPVGRVAANMTAGTLGYPRRRFAGLTAIAAAMWSLYSAAIGIGFGAWFTGNPFIAVVAGVLGGVVVGLVVDGSLRRLWRRERLRGARRSSGVGSSGVDDGHVEDLVPEGLLLGSHSHT